MDPGGADYFQRSFFFLLAQAKRWKQVCWKNCRERKDLLLEVADKSTAPVPQQRPATCRGTCRVGGWETRAAELLEVPAACPSGATSRPGIGTSGSENSIPGGDEYFCLSKCLFFIRYIERVHNGSMRAIFSTFFSINKNNRSKCLEGRIYLFTYLLSFM